MLQYRRLPLKALFNARELGGFPTKGGGVTRYGVFIRSEIPHNLPGSDLDFLRDYGLRSCMDFRGDTELQIMPNSLEGLDWVEYFHHPMFTLQSAPQGQKAGKKFQGWGEHYIRMCEEFRPWVKTALEYSANAEGAMLFNCTTGKDRTGIFTALLLSIAGVLLPDIVADYSVSMVYMWDVYPSFNFPKDLPKEFLLTPPQAMRTLLNYFEANYGGAVGYIRECGAGSDVIEAIRRKLTCEN
ncbi:MAG: tyrosine-protein phosphatase [Oscillospiraceae bacterium]|jgi:protein-tyrosine phosphatase